MSEIETCDLCGCEHSKVAVYHRGYQGQGYTTYEYNHKQPYDCIRYLKQRLDSWENENCVRKMMENTEKASREVATWPKRKLMGARATMSSRSLASYYEGK